MVFNKAKLVGFALLGLAAIGCRSDGVDSFVSATTPNPPIGAAEWKGDHYTSSGVAEASGGTLAKTQYGNVYPHEEGQRGGTRPAAAKLNPSFDQPAKGTGNQPGEYPVESNPGTGHSNAPANQPLPGQVDDTTVRRGQ